MNYRKTELEILACPGPRTLLNLALNILDSIREDEVDRPPVERIGHNLIELAIIRAQMMLECPH